MWTHDHNTWKSVFHTHRDRQCYPGNGKLLWTIFFPLNVCLKQLLISAGDGQDVCNDNEEAAGKENMQIQSVGDVCGEPGDKEKIMVDVPKVIDDDVFVKIKTTVIISKLTISNLSPSSKSWWCLVTSVSGGCSPSIPFLTSNVTTAISACENAECLNSVFASKFCISSPSHSVPILPPSHSVPILPCRPQLLVLCVFCTWEGGEGCSTLNSGSAMGPNGIISCVLKSCSAALPPSSICHFHHIIYSGSSFICLEIHQHHCIP